MAKRNNEGAVLAAVDGAMNDFRNLGTITTDSCVKGQKTVLTHFNVFLVHINHNKNRFEDLIEEELVEDLLGKFPDFLKKVRKIKKYNTRLDYCSHLRGLILSKFPHLLAYKNLKWYADMRRFIQKEALSEEFDPLLQDPASDTVEKGSSMTAKHHEFICLSLFRKSNVSVSSKNRCLMALNWPCLG